MPSFQPSCSVCVAYMQPPSVHSPQPSPHPSPLLTPLLSSAQPSPQHELHHVIVPYAFPCRMAGCVGHANDVTNTYGVTVVSINIISATAADRRDCESRVGSRAGPGVGVKLGRGTPSRKLGRGTWSRHFSCLALWTLCDMDPSWCGPFVLRILRFMCRLPEISPTPSPREPEQRQRHPGIGPMHAPYPPPCMPSTWSSGRGTLAGG